ncbi:Uncharacterized protein involved in outer membrane biogenesis [Legionella wadsworthii]|uniref:Uncharacterized protein involved in outer membrane biogenesis n=1 Tax=Legionella wadsworthii TaxID=28088 RepID=A0A378LS13_9GAMM|nr:DUF748 domain-containing protein [Legionella wadsworthii]STY28622.1 Uncharacterized protein involved in outer membrane biogenesis [Legionella wadsworthii]
MRTHFKIVYGFLLIILLTLAIVRICLPSLLIYYAEKKINRIPGYQVTIHDIDVHLLAGSYTIKGLALKKVPEIIPVPFFAAKDIILSVQWKALLHGSFVGKIHTNDPELNFVVEPNSRNQQLSINEEWQQAVKSLFPVNINQFTVKNGTIALHSFQGNPPFSLKLNNIDFSLDNLQKVENIEGLFSTFKGKGVINQGTFTISGRLDPFAEEPTFMMNSTLKSMQIKGANNFLRHFISLDVTDGQFSLFSEFGAKNGKIRGYAKPIIKKLKILNPKEQLNPVEFLYKGALEIGAKIFTNHNKKTLATKIKIEGNIEDPKTSILSIIGYVFKHAFIQALLPQLDHSVNPSV